MATKRTPRPRYKRKYKLKTATLKKRLSEMNPAKGRKVKSGRAVSVKNFTGTITRTNAGQVLIVGRGRKK